MPELAILTILLCLEQVVHYVCNNHTILKQWYSEVIEILVKGDDVHYFDIEIQFSNLVLNALYVFFSAALDLVIITFNNRAEMVMYDI